MDQFYKFISENWSKVLGGFLGFLIALIIILFGFWRALLIIALVLVGIYLGGKFENSSSIRRAISKFWGRY